MEPSQGADGAILTCVGLSSLAVNNRKALESRDCGTMYRSDPDRNTNGYDRSTSSSNMICSYTCVGSRKYLDGCVGEAVTHIGCTDCWLSFCHGNRPPPHPLAFEHFANLWFTLLLKQAAPHLPNGCPCRGSMLTLCPRHRPDGS